MASPLLYFPEQRLFDEHQVHYQDDAWIYRTATSEGKVLHVQAYFLEFGLIEESGYLSRGYLNDYRKVLTRSHDGHIDNDFKEVRSQVSTSCGKGHKLQHRFITIVFAI